MSECNLQNPRFYLQVALKQLFEISPSMTAGDKSRETAGPIAAVVVIDLIRSP